VTVIKVPYIVHIILPVSSQTLSGPRSL